MSYDFIDLKLDDGVCWLTVKNPKALNALNAALLNDLDAALDEVTADAGIRVLVITGDGEKAFVAGADIGELADQRGIGGRDFARRGQELFDRIENLGIPVIAAVNGYALGGGCELSLACHIRVASENAVFGLPEVSLGVIPGYGGTQRLPRQIGMGRALDMILSGRMVKADEALAMGLANRVVPTDELTAAVTKLAGTMMKMGPLALRGALESVRGGIQGSQAEGMRLEAQLFGLLCGTSDMNEGTSAFLEKRKAKFTGK
jgi:enoyl-CoA hydratase